MKGNPFRPVSATPVDLFPHTPHCELVVLLERVTGTRTDTEPAAVSSLEGELCDVRELDENTVSEEEELQGDKELRLPEVSEEDSEERDQERVEKEILKVLMKERTDDILDELVKEELLKVCKEEREEDKQLTDHLEMDRLDEGTENSCTTDSVIEK